MKTRLLVPVGAACAALSPAFAMAQAPATVPIQGTLADDDGAPLDGSHAFVFRVYDDPTEGEVLFTESLSVSVEDGAFTAYLGGTQVLDLDIFRGGPTYLGITVGGDDEMTPRLEFGSVPYAAHAHDGVPAGAVMHFDLESCPSGWSGLDGAQGRVLVGLNPEGTLGATVGDPLSDEENRSHSHEVSGPTANTGVPHTHRVPGGTRTTEGGGAHAHVFAQAVGKLCGVVPCVEWKSRTSSTGSLQTTVSQQRRAEPGTSGGFPFAVGNPDFEESQNYFTSRVNTHTHSVNIGNITTNDVSNTSHNHDFNATSTAARTADVIPYVQLLVCRKD